jgi:hypothetical protein
LLATEGCRIHGRDLFEPLFIVAILGAGSGVAVQPVQQGLMAVGLKQAEPDPTPFFAVL